MLHGVTSNNNNKKKNTKTEVTEVYLALNGDISHEPVDMKLAACLSVIMRLKTITKYRLKYSSYP